MRVALVHDWLTGMRGGEKCLQVLIEMFPEAQIFTLLHVPGSVSPEIEARPIHTSFINSLPGVRDIYRYYLPLFPKAIERFDLRGYDLIISTSHCAAKGAHPPDGVPHLCYCLTPMRYVWDLYDQYFGPHRVGPLVRTVMPHIAGHLRRWDRRASERVSAFVACSEHIRTKIERFYGCAATVVYPPVDAHRFRPVPTREDFYLIVSALVPYKRIDLAVAAFNQLGERLVIVGSGPEMHRLRAIAGPDVSFTGWLDDREVEEYFARCRAFIFPGEEDFGIAAVEAQAAGAPVIAYGSGGVTETVIGVNSRPTNSDGRPTGVFFHEQTTESLMAAVRQFEKLQFDQDVLRANAARFSVEAFKRGIRACVAELLPA